VETLSRSREKKTAAGGGHGGIYCEEHLYFAVKEGILFDMNRIARRTKRRHEKAEGIERT